MLQLSTFGWCLHIMQNYLQIRPVSSLPLSMHYKELLMRPQKQAGREKPVAGVGTMSNSATFPHKLLVLSGLS